MSRAESIVSEQMDEAFDSIVGFTEMIQERSYASLAQFFEHLFAAFSENFKTTLIPDTVETSYAGVHLGAEYEENDFVKMINGFNKNQPIHAKYAYQILTDGVKKLKQVENIRICDLNQAVTQLPGVIIVGDLHGNFSDLFYIIKKFGIPGKNYRFVFNGDIVDRGAQQIECLLTILYAFILYPTRVFVNRGNHEDKALNLNHNFDPNFKSDIDLKYGKYGISIFNEAQRVFRYLPLATIVKNKVGYKAFITHGGLSSRLDLNYIAHSLPRNQFDVITTSNKQDPQTKYAAEQLSDLLWSDPIVRKGQNLSAKVPSEYGCFPNSHRGIGWLFGPDVTEMFCKKYGFTTVIRSHECRPEGISRDHQRLYTIFSCSHYCQGTNEAAVIILPADATSFKVERFRTQRKQDDEAQKERNRLIVTLKRFLSSERETLLRRLSREDKDESGYVNIDTWASIISKLIYEKSAITIETRHLITLKDHLCPCEEENNVAKYKEMFSSDESKVSDRAVLDLLENIFNLIDDNRNGTISKDEAVKAVGIINKSLKTKYDHRFISNMDSNQDGVVDFDEFKKAFINAI